MNNYSAFLSAVMGLVNTAIAVDANAHDARKNAEEASLAYQAKTNNSNSAHLLEENARLAQMQAAQLEEDAKTANNAALAVIKKLFGDLSPKQIEEACHEWNIDFIRFFLQFLLDEKYNENFQSEWKINEEMITNIFNKINTHLIKNQYPPAQRIMKKIKFLEWTINIYKTTNMEPCPIVMKLFVVLQELHRRTE
jgi:hypothetical protein